jgi:coenzyme F420 biosynthesis associated uncharacterized protein
MRVPDMTRSERALTVGRAVDWHFAATVGERLARPAPPSTEYTRRQAIDDLSGAAKAAEPPVREVTGLDTNGVVPDARIVDRRQWIRAAAESMRVMTGGTDQPRGFISGRLTGAQTGAVLAFVSAGILGQYDPFAAQDGGCLLLVYPNVIAVERQLRVQPSDFRLWVCLHEVTHRVQFTANTWLSGYMSQALSVLTQEYGEDVMQVVSRLADFVRGRGSSADGTPDAHSSGVIGLLRAVQSEPQRQALDQLLVLGTLLEGHADHPPQVRRASATQATSPAAGAASFAGHRRETQPVHPRQSVRRPRRRPRRNAAIQRDLVVAGNAAVAR